MGPWDLGRWYRPLAWLSVVGCAALIVIGMQPPNERSAWVVGAFAIAMAAAWFGGVRHRFPGPPHAAIAAFSPGERSRSDEGASWTHRQPLSRGPRSRIAIPRRPDSTILERIRSRTPARILAGRAGASYRTSTYLELRADHAAARDAVTTELDLDADLGAAFVAEWGLFEVADAGADQGGLPAAPRAGPVARPVGAARDRGALPRRASTSRWRSPTASRPRRCGRRSPRSCR